MEDLNPLYPENYKDAIIGLDEKNGKYIISKDICVSITMKELKADYTTALEFLEFNVFHSYFGEYTPVFIWEQKFDEINEMYGLL
jgi:hypothetical protein